MVQLQDVKQNLDFYNERIQSWSYEEVIDWAFQLTQKRIVTTSFGRYSAVLLSTFYQKDAAIPVVWVDTWYTGQETYGHQEYLTHRFQLNLKKYESRLSRVETDELFEQAQDVNSTAHKQFAEAVKLEPFRRAMQEQQPELWFTNIRVRQTEYRNKKDILSLSKQGILKVSPFYYWSDEDLDQYLDQHNLPKNDEYFDPVKVLSHRECGIHLQ